MIQKWIFVGVRTVCLAAMFAGAGGCASLGTYNPATGRSELIFIPPSQEVAMGEELHEKMRAEMDIVETGAEAERTNRIGQRVAQTAERQDYPYHFYLVRDDQLNAFTIPGGRIYIFTGLVDRLETDDEIASVLGHEIGHGTGRHTVKKFQAAVGYDLVGGVVLSQLGLSAQVEHIVSLSSNAVMSIVFSAYGRQDEYEADQLGLRYMRRAGYDPEAMIKTFRVLESASGDGGPPLFLRSHPYLGDRIKKVREQIP